MKFLAVTILFAVAVGVAAAKNPQPASASVAVHEWGVFRVSEDVDFANAGLRAEWDDLPAFAYGHIKGRAVPQHWGAVEIRKAPIIFFHAKEPVVLHVKVEFPGGMPGVWFPATANPAVDGLEKGGKIGTSLEWTIGVKQCPNGWLPKGAAPPEVLGKHWINDVRKVNADEVFARFSPNHTDVEREKFLFYDGVFPQKRWLKITVDGGRVSLTSRVKHPVYDITVVDRRNDEVRIGRVAKLEPGAAVDNVNFVDVDAARFVTEAVDQLIGQLVKAGLFEDEAKSLVAMWKGNMFETPGLNLFYRLPQSEYDAVMPLTLTPRPEAIVRVGLIYHGHLEPDFADRVLKLVKQLDSARFAERDAALKKLLAVGPPALVQLERLRERKDLSVEVRERINALVKKWSVKEAFEQ